MANVSVGFFGSITFMDGRGKKGTTTLKLTAADAATAATDLAAIVAAYVAITDAVLVSYHFYEEFVNDAAAFPAATVLLSTKALMEFEIKDNPTKSATLSVPSPKQAIFVAVTGPNSTIVDLADAEVITWRSLFQDGGEAYLSDGEVAELLRKGQKITRGSSGS